MSKIDEIDDKKSSQKGEIDSGDRVPSKSINTLHYYYGATVLGVIIVVLVSLMFAESTYAGSMLSFAATLSSILLAVIAIIITLIDVAGQRSNIFDVKNSVEDLKTVSHEISQLVSDFENRIQRRDDEMITLMS